MEKFNDNRRNAFLEGIRDGIPVFIGFLPISLTYAMLAIHAGFSSLETSLMSVSLLAGASQMMAVSMYAMGSGIAGIIMATCILNFRHLIMSTYVMNRMRNTPLLLRMLLSFGITDESFAIFAGRKSNQHNTFYFAGLAGMTYFSWIFGSIAGIIVLPLLPQIFVKSMAIALYAMFIALLMPDIRKGKRISCIVLASMSLNFLLVKFLPSGTALIITTLATAWGGTFLGENKEEKRYE